MSTSLILGQTLDLKNKLYQKALWPGVAKVAAGDTLNAPLMVEIDPTSFCDFACPECVSIDLLNHSKFTSDRLVALANELVELGVVAAIFVGGGEPLIHPAMPKVLEICGKGSIKVGIITNGTMIAKYRETLAKYTEWVRVSVDAGTAETFDVFRPHRSKLGQFDAIIRNMQLLKEAGIRRMGYSFLLMLRVANGDALISNYMEVYKAGVLAKSIGCHYFELKPLFDPVTHIVCEQPPALINELIRQLDELRGIEDANFRVIYPQSLIELIHGSFMAKLYDYGKCHISELRTLIAPHGVYICPLYRGKAQYSFGDPTTQTLREIWASPRRAELMNAIKPCRDCLPKCSRHLSNMEIDRIGKGAHTHSLLDDFDLFF